MPDSNTPGNDGARGAAVLDPVRELDGAAPDVELVPPVTDDAATAETDLPRDAVAMSLARMRMILINDRLAGRLEPRAIGRGDNRGNKP